MSRDWVTLEVARDWVCGMRGLCEAEVGLFDAFRGVESDFKPSSAGAVPRGSV